MLNKGFPISNGMNISSKTFLYFGIILLGVGGFFFTIFLPYPQGFYAFVVMAALGGFSVSANVWHTKKNHKELVCPMGSNCNVVVNSRYSKFFGIRLEYMGMAYFTIIILGYLALIFFPQFFVGGRLIALAMLTIAAALFSCYLLFVQAVLLRSWCIWCVLASMMSLTVFFISLISLPLATGFLTSIENIIVMLQFLGFVLGMGGATSAVFLFLNNFLKDSSIDEDELQTLQSFYELVWFGFGLVLISQFAMYVTAPGILSESPTFIMRIISLLVSGFSGALLMIIFAPFLIYVPFTKPGAKPHGSWLLKLRTPIFVVGAIAMASWYFAFATHFMPVRSLDKLIIAYLIFLGLSVIAGMLWEEIVGRSTPPPKLD